GPRVPRVRRRAMVDQRRRYGRRPVPGRPCLVGREPGRGPGGVRRACSLERPPGPGGAHLVLKEAQRGRLPSRRLDPGGPLRGKTGRGGKERRVRPGRPPPQPQGVAKPSPPPPPPLSRPPHDHPRPPRTPHNRVQPPKKKQREA